MKESCFKGCFCSKAGFTLIELLVVVLIIGILAAVAVPQYQVAVTKSRYATLKEFAKSFANAQEVYYLANGHYADSFEKLDIDTPGGWTNPEEMRDDTRAFEWGNCRLGTSSLQCSNDKMAYQIYYHHADKNAKQVRCIAWNENVSSIENKVCKIETELPTYSARSSDPSYTRWTYPD